MDTVPPFHIAPASRPVNEVPPFSTQQRTTKAIDMPEALKLSKVDLYEA